MRRALPLLVVLAALATACSYETREFVFDVDELETAQSSRVFDRNGVLITELRGEQNRTDVTDLALIPEVVRNAVVANDFVLISSNGAINLYIGNNEKADGTSARIPDLQELTGINKWSWFLYDRIVEGVSRHEGRPMKYSEVSAWFSRRALDHITSHPGGS